MKHQSSFRDPLGYVFSHKGKIYRWVSKEAAEDYDSLMSCGLYGELTEKGLLLAHREVSDPRVGTTPDTHRVLLPEQLRFVSYPYEWSFSHYKDAALLTAQIQKIALAYGMVLKDASSYNVQLHRGRQVFIDTLSFSKLKKPFWEGYKQYCEHFLSPLLLMSKVDLRMGLLMRDFIDGIPLEITTKLLPAWTKARPSVLTHIAAHSAAQQKYAGTQKSAHGGKTARISKTRLIATVDSMERLVKSLTIPKKSQTEWNKYYEFTNYSDTSFRHKQKLVKSFAREVKPDVALDIGGNDGSFVRDVQSAHACFGMAADIDSLAVERGYMLMRKKSETDFIPIRLDLTNPSPALGWANAERMALPERLPGKKRLILSLALIHHLAISNNLPLEKVAEYCASLGDYLVMEFVPKSDSKVQILFTSREDIFPNYTIVGFEAAFAPFFTIQTKQKIRTSERVLYLMKKRG